MRKLRKTIILAFAVVALAVCATVTGLVRAYADDTPPAPATPALSHAVAR
jgi:hypothetical protein